MKGAHQFLLFFFLAFAMVWLYMSENEDAMYHHSLNSGGLLPSLEETTKLISKPDNAFTILAARQNTYSEELNQDSVLYFDVYDGEAQLYPISVTASVYEECFQEEVATTTGPVPRVCPSDAKEIRGYMDSTDIKEKTMKSRRSTSSCHPLRFPPKEGNIRPLPSTWPACPLQGGLDPASIDLQVGAGFSSADFAKLAKLLRGEFVDPGSIGSEATRTFISANCKTHKEDKITARAGEEMQYQSLVKLELPTVIMPKDLYDNAPEAVKNLPFMKIKSSASEVHQEAMQSLIVHCGSGLVMVEYTMVLYENVRKAAELTRSWKDRDYNVPKQLQQEIDAFDTRKDVREYVLGKHFGKSAQDARFSDTSFRGLKQRPLNMLMVMLDGVSRGNFYRTMPNTLTYFQESLKNPASPFRLYDFELNNVLGVNSMPNQNPMYSGYDESKLAYDQIIKNLNGWNKQAPWVFDWLEAMGYVTAYGEQLWTDKPANMDHTSIRRYFWKNVIEPADYNNDNFALPHWGYLNFSEDQRCQLGRRIMQLTNECIVSFHQAHYNLDDTPTFMAVHTFEGHDASERVQNSADMDTRILLETMGGAGLLDNTIVILNADHGLHYGPLLKHHWAVEEQKNPVFFMLVPTQLVEKYPELDRNLATNQKRLFGPYDIYATFLHLPFLHTGMMDPPARHEKGVSLFTEIPANRTCEQAGISNGYCQCFPLREVPVVDLKAEPDKVINGITYSQLITIKNIALAYINDMVAASPIATSKCAKVAFKDFTTVRSSLTNFGRTTEGVEVDFIIVTTSEVQAGSVEHKWRSHVDIPASGDRTPRLWFVHRMSPYSNDKKVCGVVDKMKHFEYCVCKEAAIATS